MRDVKREERPTDLVCEKCGKPMVIKWGRRGEFLACSGYPECTQHHELHARRGRHHPAGRARDRPTRHASSAASRCRCASAASASSSAARAIPECKSVQPLLKPMPTGIKCLACGEGEMLERRSRRGKIFYSCNRYPDCTVRGVGPARARAVSAVQRAVRHREGDEAQRHGAALRAGRLRLAGAASTRTTNAWVDDGGAAGGRGGRACVAAARAVRQRAAQPGAGGREDPVARRPRPRSSVRSRRPPAARPARRPRPPAAARRVAARAAST